MLSKALLLVVVGILYTKVNSAEDQHFPGFGGSGSSYVVGGETVKLGEFPYQISFRRDPFGHECGGSVVNKDWVLTAAHCVPLNGDTRGLAIWAGTINNKDKSKAVEIPVKKIVVHPEFKHTPKPFYVEYDVALLQLRTSLEFGPNIQPITLPKPSDRPTGDTVISGWGEMKHNRSYGLLQKATLNLVSDEECRAVYRDLNVKIPDSQLCGGDKGGNKAHCFGDSGGPWVIPGTRTQIGVISYVWGGNCTSPKYPSVAMEVPYFTSWIQTTVQSG